MKLNLARPTPPPNLPPKKTGYESPVGWWSATTSGNDDGSTTKNLGTFYGHVAEIALHLADQSFFGIQLSPVLNVDAIERPNYQATGMNVNMSLDVCSKTWDLLSDRRADWFRKWFDTDDVVVSSSQYYASVYVTLK